MNQQIRKETAKKVIQLIKSCEDIMNETVITANVVIPSEEYMIFKAKIGDFLGYLYLDIYRKNLVKEFADLAGTLEEI